MKVQTARKEKHTLTNGQIEILRMFSKPMNKTEIEDLRNILKEFLSKRIDNEVDEIWEKRNLSQNDLDELLSTHTKRRK